MSRPEQDVPLDEAALLIAAHAHPDLDLDTELARFDRLADRVEGNEVDAISEVLFHREGLAGNARDYSNPENSYLNRVLDRRLGIPISLSVVLLEVGRRVGADLDGIGFPGHYMVRDRRQPNVLIDAYGGGRHLDKEACAAILGDDSLRPPEDPAEFHASGTRVTLARMLANLERTFRGRQDLPNLTWVTRLRAAIPDQPVFVLSDASETLADLGRYDEAAAIIEDMQARGRFTADEGDVARARAVALRARLN